MKIFANGFNLYGQLIRSNKLVSDFDVIFESEVIRNFGINYSYSYFHLNDSLLIFPKSNKEVKLDANGISKLVSNDKRIVILYEDGRLNKLDFGDESPKQLPNLNNTEEFDKIVNVSCGSKINIFYSEKGYLFSISNQLNFVNKEIVHLECGREHCLLLDKYGNVYAFGRGSRGQLGTGSLDDERDPVLVEALAGLKISKISAGGWHSCALSSTGDLYTWGWNANGQLGLAKSDNQNELYTVQATPQLIECFGTDLNVKNVASGNRHTMVILDNNQLYGCGWNKYKQLKNATEEEFSAFTFLHDFSKEEVLDLRTGPWNSAVLCK